MNIKWLRVLIAALIIEILAVLVLVIVVAVAGPGEPDAAMAFAERVGVWLGPLAGFVLCFLGSWLLTRTLDSDRVPNGLALGIAVALIDIILLVVGGSGFRWVFAASNVGKVLAGYLGALMPARQTEPA